MPVHRSHLVVMVVIVVIVVTSRNMQVGAQDMGNCEDGQQLWTDCLPTWALTPDGTMGRFTFVSQDNITIPAEDIDQVNQDLALVVGDLLQVVEEERNCAVLDTEWRAGVMNFFAQRGLNPASPNCISRYSLTHKIGQRYEALQDLSSNYFAKWGQPWAGFFDSRTIWPLGPWRFDFQAETQVCNIHTLTLASVDGEWSVVSSLTNMEPNLALEDTKRMYLMSLLRIDISDISNPRFLNETVQIRTPQADPNNRSGPGAGTLRLDIWGGKAGLATVTDQAPLQNPLVDMLLKQDNQNAELFQETLLPSNIAILAMPMVINLVPSHTVKLKTWSAIFLFILATDIVTTLPFLIKGVELITQARSASAGLVAYHVGNWGESQHLQLWLGSCGIAKSPVPGIVFLVVGFFMLALGMFLEVVTHKRTEVVDFAKSVHKGRRTSRRKSTETNDTDLEFARDDNTALHLESTI